MRTGIHFFKTIEAAELAGILEAWREAYPGMGVLSLVAEADRETAVPVLQDVCSRRNVRLCGAVFPALLHQSRFHNRGCILLRFDAMPFAALYDPLKPDSSSSAELLQRMARDVADRVEHRRDCALFLVFDAMVVNITSLLDALYLKLADGVRYFGVNAGSETFRPMPCLFDNERVAGYGVLLMLLPHHPGAVVEHCYHAPERMVLATSTEGSRIATIDWRSPFEVYREVVEAEYGVKINRGNFYQYAVHFPFGIVRAGREILVRIPVALEQDGSLFCVGEVPPNAVLTLLRAPAADPVPIGEALERGLGALYGEVAAADILIFYCAGRRLHLGEAAQGELIELKRRMNRAEFTGALSLGEVGQSQQGGYPLFHNGALLCSTWR